MSQAEAPASPEVAVSPEAVERITELAQDLLYSNKLRDLVNNGYLMGDQGIEAPGGEGRLSVHALDMSHGLQRVLEEQFGYEEYDLKVGVIGEVRSAKDDDGQKDEARGLYLIAFSTKHPEYLKVWKASSDEFRPVTPGDDEKWEMQDTFLTGSAGRGRDTAIIESPSDPEAYSEIQTLMEGALQKRLEITEADNARVRVEREKAVKTLKESQEAPGWAELEDDEKAHLLDGENLRYLQVAKGNLKGTADVSESLGEKLAPALRAIDNLLKPALAIYHAKNNLHELELLEATGYSNIRALQRTLNPATKETET